MPELTIAIAKGRLEGAALDLLDSAGIKISPAERASRRLAIEDQSRRYRFVFVKPADVPVYVSHGVADCGLVGRDVLLECDSDLLEPLSLDIGYCRIVVAAPISTPLSNHGTLRVATKYSRIAEQHFARRGQPVEIIPLSGSVELAPGLGLADCIVDLVETGKTLSDNGLCIVDVITASTARLVVNRASYQLKAPLIGGLIKTLSAQVSSGSQS